MSLGTLVKEVTGLQSIKGLMVKSYKEERKTPPLKWEDDSFVRASGFADMCPRAAVIASLNDIITTDKTNSELLLIFAHGTALHWILQNNVMPKIGILLGEWICLSCGKLYGKPEGTKPLLDTIVKQPEKCTTVGCKSVEFYYKELHFKDNEYRIAGHPDGFLEIQGMPGLGIFEAKSCSGLSSMKVQKNPYMSHIAQVNIYFLLTGLKWAKILYWNKEENGINAFTEHTIYRDEEMIDLIKEQLTKLWQGIKTKTVPEREICDAIDCSRAKLCNVKDICFNVPSKKTKMKV